MRRISRNRFLTPKKGFTLIEVVLAIAIMLIVIPMVVGSFIIVARSHQSVLQLNDAKDLAYITATAIDNKIINAESIIVSTDESVAGGYSVLSFSGGDTFLNGVKMFDYPHFSSQTPGVNKWNVVVTFNAEPLISTVLYKIDIIDNDNGSTFYSLQSSSFLPNTAPDDFAGTNGTTIKFKYP